MIMSEEDYMKAVSGVTDVASGLQEVRCKCNRLLCKVDKTMPYRIEIKCPKCKTTQMRWRDELADFGPSPILEHMHLMEMAKGIPEPLFQFGYSAAILEKYGVKSVKK